MQNKLIFSKLVNREIEHIEINNSKIGDGLFCEYPFQSISLPNCTTIGSCAFHGCKSLLTVSIPNCTTVGSSAFRDCMLLRSISFPNCTTIGSCAFYSCAMLSSVSLPNCTTIGSYGFYACSSLTTINLPKCTTVNERGFYYCTNLATISIPNCTTVDSSAFTHCTSLTNLFLPKCIHLGASVASTTTLVILYSCIQTIDSAASSARYKFMHSAGDTVLFSDASFLVQGARKTAKTYYIYTNNPTISSMCAARAGSYTTVNIYSF